MSLEIVSSDSERIVVSIDPTGTGDVSKRVEVSLYVHESGFVVVDMDAGSKADIDVDVYDYTALIVRNGEVAGE